MEIRVDKWNTRMKVMRIVNGWDQKIAAQKCGTNQKAYWQWENGLVYPRKNSREAIERAFGIKIFEE